MTYTELLDRFWGMERNFSCLESTLYHYILYRCNNLGWPDTFSLSNEELMQRLRCRLISMREARKVLVDAGLISYQSGTGRGGTSYYSVLAEKGVRLGTPFEQKGVRLGTPFDAKRGTNGNTFLEGSNLESGNNDPATIEKGVRLGTPFEQFKTEEKQEKKNFPPAPPIKEKKEKKKEITQSKTLLQPHGLTGARTRTREDENGQLEIVFKELKEKPLKKKREPVEPILPESIDEVVSFFETKGRELQDWRAEAEAFFYHYDSVGWMGTSNRKITDWKSRAHLWIADKTVKEKQQALKTNGTTTNQSGSTRESRFSDAVDLIGELLSQNEIEG